MNALSVWQWALALPLAVLWLALSLLFQPGVLPALILRRLLVRAVRRRPR